MAKPLVGDLADELEMLHLGIGENLIQRVDGRARDVVGATQLEPMIAILRPEYLGKKPVEHVIILLTVALGLEALVLAPFRATGRARPGVAEFHRRRQV